ncbi:(Lyso)-N-acylphosphatidylethanolamine lipase isoform X2 [Carcharodon carcharias]|uniref:(Lyso)-N-acylphosphatidylethanolamine lipase isoform X2 n=1 Tax=Carcharodon carcharias TaxID=13397 RepID=UPI001B7E8182|nr:(Lyso)-N-acylphosphatidylethanolamine lipase isoform X2 [Carcharodon carcharias]
MKGGGGMEEDTEQETQGWFSSWFPVWCPTSMAQLKTVEGRILAGIKTRFESRYVSLPSNHRIWTLALSPETLARRTPLVLVHGFGGGLGLWVQNLEPLSRRQPVYAFDLLGFGRSSRPPFPGDPEAVEAEFVSSIEEWRAQLGLPSMILLGHSLGGFLAASYTIKHPERVKHLILVDPWGFPERPADLSESWKPPMWVKAAATILGRFNFLAVLRAAGPWGPSLVQRFRPDLKQKYERFFQDDTILEYVYHCNAQSPSGEAAFKVLSESFGWAKRPMLGRIHLIPKEIPITMIYGSRSWIEPSSGEKVKCVRPESYVRTMAIEGASHHVYADKPEEFNAAIVEICDSVPNGSSPRCTPTATLRPSSSSSSCPMPAALPHTPAHTPPLSDSALE